MNGAAKDKHSLEFVDKYQSEYKLEDGDTLTPLVLQKYILVAFAHRQQRPRSDLPSFIVLDFALSDEEVQEKLDAISEKHEYNIFSVRTHQLMVICESISKQQNEEYNKKILETRISQHIENQDHRNQRFISRINMNKSSEDQLPDPISVEEEQKLRAVDLPDLENPDPSGIEMAERQECNFCVLILLDLCSNEPKEPAVSFLACFSTLEQAESYSKHVASHQYPLCDIYVVQTKKWVSPYCIDKEKIRESYRNSRLDEIMRNRKEEQQKCDTLLRENKATVKEISLDNQ